MTITVDPRISVTFAQRGNNASALWLEMKTPDEAQPTDLLAALAAAGWTVNPRFDPIVVPAPPEATRQPEDPTYAIRHLILRGPSGTGLHGSWTEQEAQTHVASARKVLVEFGFPTVDIWRKSKSDQL